MKLEGGNARRGAGGGFCAGTAAFTLLELLVVLSILGVVAAGVLSAAVKTRAAAQGIQCVNNLKQWGLATLVYAADNNDLLPREGTANPPHLPSTAAHVNNWYCQLPQTMGMPWYYDNVWRTNAGIDPGRALWICPANARRSNGNNLFHYCLNDGFDGTGPNDHTDIKLSALPCPPAAVVWLFDSKNLPAWGPQSYVHTNLHDKGANLGFLDGHVKRFPVSAYRDSAGNPVSNHPELIWDTFP